MGSEFAPVFLFLIVAIAIAASMVVASALFAPKKLTRVKQMPYESGMDPSGDARQRFDVRFYLVAIVFLLFAVELLFLYPWAVAQWEPQPQALIVSRQAQAQATGATLAAPEAPARSRVVTAGIPAEFRGLVFWEIMVFIVILSAAFAYAWRNGVFSHG